MYIYAHTSRYNRLILFVVSSNTPLMESTSVCVCVCVCVCVQVSSSSSFVVSSKTALIEDSSAESVVGGPHEKADEEHADGATSFSRKTNGKGRSRLHGFRDNWATIRCLW